MTQERTILVETALAIRASLTPADPAVIAVCIEKLAQHYPAPSRNGKEAMLAVEDWLDDLAEYPADLIAEACRLWRNSSERFFPTPGQLKAKVEQIHAHRRTLGRRAAEFLALVEGGEHG